MLDNPFSPATVPMSKSQQLRAKKLAKQQGQPEQSKDTPAESAGTPRQRITQYVMNLPDSAITFLGAFRGLLSPSNVGGRDLSGAYPAEDSSMPMVHCYCFTREAEPDKAEVDIRQVSFISHFHVNDRGLTSPTARRG